MGVGERERERGHSGPSLLHACVSPAAGGAGEKAAKGRLEVGFGGWCGLLLVLFPTSHDDVYAPVRPSFSRHTHNQTPPKPNQTKIGGPVPPRARQGGPHPGPALARRGGLRRRAPGGGRWGRAPAGALAAGGFVGWLVGVDWGGRKLQQDGPSTKEEGGRDLITTATTDKNNNTGEAHRHGGAQGAAGRGWALPLLRLDAPPLRRRCVFWGGSFDLVGCRRFYV